MIALIDYGMGNLRSVEKAFEKVNARIVKVSSPDKLPACDSVVLPGVGAFGDCMKNLESQGLIEPLKALIKSGKPFLGICLGYQALFDASEESDGRKGLSLFGGKVIQFPHNGLKVPQIGWNSLSFKKSNCPLLKGLPDGSHVYFVHSYFPVPSDTDIVCTETEYGGNFSSMVWKDNVFGCQFHPEKSQKVGLQIIKNFVELTKS